MSKVVRRALAILCLGLLFVWCARTVGAQQTSSAPVPANPIYFTGNAFNLDSGGARLSRMEFEPAARDHWHIHGGGQLLLVQQGRMRVQVEGQPIKEFGQGESVYLPGGVAHWHGAAPDQACIQISVTFVPVTIKVLNPVTDAQYSGKADR